MATKKILAVDDEEDILELLAFNLAREGYQVVSAATGEEALKAAPREVPDLIILDLMLPGIDGLEVARRFKNDPNTKRILQIASVIGRTFPHEILAEVADQVTGEK